MLHLISLWFTWVILAFTWAVYEVGRRSQAPGSPFGKKDKARWQAIRRIAGWVRGEFIPTARPARFLTRILDRIQFILETQGLKGSLSWIKRRRQEYLRYLGSELGSSEERLYRQRLIRNWGRSQARVLLKRRPADIRLVLTALITLRSFVLPVKVDLTPITGPFVGTDRFQWKSYVPLFWREIRRRGKVPSPGSVTWQKCHFALKAGPNGPALWTALRDLVSVLKIKTLVRSISELGGSDLHRVMEALSAVTIFLGKFEGRWSYFSTSPGLIRKLVGIQDLEGKTRVIAILDYWSQTALQPLHDFNFLILKMIPQDMTFHQGAFVDVVKRWGETTLYSIDLTNATDRFPIVLIGSVLEGWFSRDFVRAWKDVMVGYPFRTPTGEDVSYSVGNPMGARSSWSSFALAHHFVMFWCCSRLGTPWKSAKYVILGDDVLIGDGCLAGLYLATLSSLGVEVSSSKTYVSDNMCEFAKRYLYNQEEVTPFPISSVLENRGDVGLLVSTLTGEMRKGLIPSSGIPGAIGGLSRVFRRSHKVTRDLVRKARDAELSMHLIQGWVEPGEYILKLNHALDEASKDYLVGITPYLIQEGCRKVISKSLASRSSSFGPVVLQQIREIQTEMKAVGFPVSSLELVPLVEVVTSFSRKAGILYKKGINFMEDPDPSLVSDLSEFLIDPLSDRTWRVDRSLKKARAFGRFGTAVRTASVKALRSFEVGISEDREVIYLVMPGRTSIPAPIGHRDMILSGGLPPLRIVKAYRRKGMTLDDI